MSYSTFKNVILGEILHVILSKHLVSKLMFGLHNILTYIFLCLLFDKKLHKITWNEKNTSKNHKKRPHIHENHVYEAHMIYKK